VAAHPNVFQRYSSRKPCRRLAVPMADWLGKILTCVVLSVPVNIRAAQMPPAPDNPLQAQLPLGFNFKKRCPDLRIADAGALAVVVFWLSRSGTPSQMSIKSSSGSDALDSAAISCVSRLRFPPATMLGDGQPIDSWQQIALTSVSQNSAGAPHRVTADARQEDAGGHANSATVRVCVDEKGKLRQDPAIVRSSGRPSLDQAAVKIAAAGSAFYRPDTSSDGAPTSGCAELAITFDGK
jgi:TonB family protein